MKLYQSVYLDDSDTKLDICRMEHISGGNISLAATKLILIEKVLNPVVYIYTITKLLKSNKKEILDSFKIKDINSLRITLSEILLPYKIIVKYINSEGWASFGNTDTSTKDANIVLYLGNKIQELNSNTFKDFIKGIEVILGHELIHRLQVLEAEVDKIKAKKGIEYYKNPIEVMAHAWQIVETFTLNGISPKDILQIIKYTDSYNMKKLGGSAMEAYFSRFKIDSKTIKLLLKYIYLYTKERL